MKHILAAVDEDKVAGKVVALAATWAQQCGAALTICHVMPKDRYHKIETRQLRDNVKVTFSISQAEMQAQEFATDVAQLLQGQDITFTAVGRVGEPADEIVALAREVEADLVVLGFEGLSGLERIRALGSVSRTVLEHTNLPVLVVPAASDEQ